MRRARVRSGGRIEDVAVQGDGTLQTAEGRTLDPDHVEWLPPPHGTLIALGLNYRDHAAELEFKAPAEPLVFLKTSACVTGHRQPCCRPDSAQNMHYEGELVAVIGRTAQRVARAEALSYVGGYTICNDFAVRDYLENYYRPGLRVKCRDSLTPLGPWITDAADVGDPHALWLRTWVNGELRQDGNTRDLVFDIPYLIEYLSAFMTLHPGDMISTGTPQGVSNVMPGDEIVVEVERVGRLVNRVVREQEYEQWRVAPVERT